MQLNPYQYDTTGGFLNFLPASVVNIIEQYEHGVVHTQDNAVVLDGTKFARPEKDTVDRSSLSRFHKYKQLQFTSELADPKIVPENVYELKLTLAEEIVKLVLTIFTLGLYRVYLTRKFTAAVYEGGEKGIAAAVEAYRLGAFNCIFKSDIWELASNNRMDSLEFLAAQEEHAHLCWERHDYQDSSHPLYAAVEDVYNSIQTVYGYTLRAEVKKVCDVYLKYHIEVDTHDNSTNCHHRLQENFTSIIVSNYHVWWKPGTATNEMAQISKLFVKYGVKPEQLFSNWTKQLTRFWTPQAEVARFWLDLGIDPKVHIQSGDAMIHSLLDMSLDDPLLIEKLLKNGAKPDPDGHFWRRILDEVHVYNVPALRVMLKSGFMPPEKLLKRLVIECDAELINMLLELSDKQNIILSPELIVEAVYRGNQNILKSILEYFKKHKISPTANDLEYALPGYSIHTTRQSFRPEIGQMLLDYGAPVSARALENVIQRKDFKLMEALRKAAGKEVLQAIEKAMQERYQRSLQWVAFHDAIVKSINE